MENMTTDDGGGIFISDSAFIIETSTVANNQAGDEGGGIHFLGADTTGTISNTTISGNTAEDEGGGMILEFLSSVSLTNSTITNNTANRTAGGISVSSLSPISIRNSLIAGNVGGPGASSRSEIFMGSRDVLSLLGNNLIGDNSKTSDEAISFTPLANAIVATSDGNRPTSINSILEPLADNSGPTFTHALSGGSPAISAGTVSECPENDQRGFPRDDETAFFFHIVTANNNVVTINLDENTCDIGAYEFDD